MITEEPLPGFNRHDHWENIFHKKHSTEVSWYEHKPQASIALIQKCGLPSNASIIDIGAGDSRLVDNLFGLGYRNISVLDVSETALGKIRSRIGQKADYVKFIQADACLFEPTEKYDLWHDRLTFHFLTEEIEIESYISILLHSLKKGGYFILSTFSDKGPTTCSGIDVKRYSEISMHELFKPYFEKNQCLTIDHTTPTGIKQNLIYCRFRKL